MACTDSPLCQLWLLQLPLLVFLVLVLLWKAKMFQMPFVPLLGILAGGDQRGPLDSAPAPPSLLQLCSHLRNFPQSGQGDPGAFTPTCHSSFGRARGSHSPLPNPQPLPGTRTGAHTATAGRAVPCPNCRIFFPPSLSWAVG